jgi:sugar/nucleoside kinase (ribokinase family)
VTKIAVAGLINLETTLKVDGFPIDYTPVRYPFFGVHTHVSGVGFNISKALTILSDQVQFLSLIGKDETSNLVYQALRDQNIDTSGVRTDITETAQSVILFDSTGRRMINTDLKNIQDAVYPADLAEAALRSSELAILCNINFSRPMLSITKRLGIPIVSDVHTISDLDDSYNRDYMAAANILFQSHEKLSCSPKEWVSRLWKRYGTEIVIIGLGAEGVLLAVKADNFVERLPAVKTRKVVNTIGAGDALLSSFTHFYAKDRDPYKAIQKAQVFASYKIGASGGAADGFLSEAELEALIT